MNWIHSTAITQADIARRLGISKGAFRNKLYNIQRGKRPPDKFTPDELQRLESIRLAIISELG